MLAGFLVAQERVQWSPLAGLAVNLWVNVKGGAYLGYLSDHQLLKDCASWSWCNRKLNYYSCDMLCFIYSLWPNYWTLYTQCVRRISYGRHIVCLSFRPTYQVFMKYGIGQFGSNCGLEATSSLVCPAEINNIQSPFYKLIHSWSWALLEKQKFPAFVKKKKVQLN
jgi:hypothetical protein